MVSEMSETTQQDVEIEVDPAATVADEPEIIVADEEPAPKAAPPDVDDAVAALKAQLQAAEQGRADAERRAREEAARAHAAEQGKDDSDLQVVTTAIETVKTIGGQLKAQYSAALRAQDFDAAAEIQEAMAINASKLMQLENGKQAMEAAPKREAAPMPVADPVEALAGQLSPRSAAWVRAHPDYARDGQKLRKMIAAHNLAEADGIPPDTDAYFEHIESTLKIRQPAPVEDVDPMADTARVTQRRSAPASAPVTRSGNGTGQRPNTVRLTAAEREIASDLGMSEQDYARNKLALQKEGKLH